MILAKMINFCKSLTCPTSQDLLTFQKGQTSVSMANEIIKHLELCEFCEAEVAFYEHYPQSEETVKTDEIPSPLFELAEALLNNKHKDRSILNKLLGDNESLTLRKA